MEVIFTIIKILMIWLLLAVVGYASVVFLLTACVASMAGVSIGFGLKAVGVLLAVLFLGWVLGIIFA